MRRPRLVLRVATLVLAYMFVLSAMQGAVLGAGSPQPAFQAAVTSVAAPA